MLGTASKEDTPTLFCTTHPPHGDQEMPCSIALSDPNVHRISVTGPHAKKKNFGKKFGFGIVSSNHA